MISNRNKIRKYMISFIFVAVLIVPLWSNSVFSPQGLPLKYYGNDVYSLGMGESGIADVFRVNTGYFNPSLPVTSTNVTFSTALSMGYMWYKDSDNNRFRDDGIFFPYFSFSIPLSNHYIGFNFNSYASGNLENQKEDVLTIGDDEFSYTEKNRIRSNIFKGDIVYAFKNDILNLGLSLNYYFGHRTRRWEIDFDDNLIADARYELERRFKNPGITIGANKRFGSTAVAALYSSPIELEGETIRWFNHYPGADTLATKSVQFEVPTMIAGGITHRFTDYYKASFDLYYELWEQTETYDKNSFKAAFGLAYDPAETQSVWWKSIPVRVGTYYRQLPFEKNDTGIDEIALSWGTSIPLQSPNKQIDFAVTYLTRGNTNDHDLSDSSLMFTFGVTGFDIFSRRTRRIGHRDIPEAD